MGSSRLIIPLLVAFIAAFVAAYWSRFLGIVSSGSRGIKSSSSTILTSKRSMNIDGLTFPTDIKIAGSMQSLIGGGTRSKWGFRVYAVGIYGDPKLIVSLTKKHLSGESSNSNKKAMSKLSREFSESHQARTLLLKFHRQVPASDMAEALGDALSDKIGKDSSDKFSSFVLGLVGRRRGVIEKGTDLYITCKGNKLWASINEGNDTDKIIMKDLCPAIFSVYLGDTPVSPQVKEGFDKGFA